MINYSRIQKKEKILIDEIPYEIIEASSMFKGRGHSVLQAKIKNLITGEIISKTFHPSDSFEEVQISKVNCKFLYSHRENYFFCEKLNPGKRFNLEKKKIENLSGFLKENMEVEGIVFNDNIINIALPIKVSFEVKEAPPGIKGDRAQGGTKVVTLETGKKINAPLFIEEKDIIEVNTETGEYVKRILK